MIKAITFHFGNVICAFDNDLFRAKISEHIHILVGHVKKYYIPRKGAGVMFSKIENS